MRPGGPWGRLGLLALVLFASCRPAQRPARPLTLGAPALPTLGLLDIATQRGEFSRQGVAVERQAFQTGREALAALLAGKLDLAACYDAPLVLAALEHPELRVLTSLHHASRATVVVARRDRSIQVVEDLRGHRVGVPRATNAAFFLDTLLAFSGLSPAEVTPVDLAPEATPAALARGEVDAIAIWYPLARRAREALPPEATVELTSELYTEISLLVVREDVLRLRLPELTAVLRALSAAEGLVQHQPAEAFAALQAAYPQERADDLREDWARVRAELGLRNAMLAVLEREARWVLRARGSSGPGPDFRALFAPGPLSAVDPEVITVYAPLPPVGEGASP